MSAPVVEQTPNVARQFRDSVLALARRHPLAVTLVWGAALAMAAADGYLVFKRVGYGRETSRLRARLTAVERSRLDAELRNDSNKGQIIIALARRQARGDEDLHLSVSLDSAQLTLEQGGATLRVVPVDVGPDAWIRTGTRDSVRITAPLGTRTIERVVDDTSLVLSGGALVYARSAGDTARRARPGAIRVGAEDLRVIAPNLKPGQRVYFY